MASGSTLQGLDRCIKRPSDITTIEFINEEIEVKTVVSGSLMTINMQYDILNCPKIDTRTNEDNQTV